MMKLKIKKRKTALTRVFAIKMLLVMLFQIGFPTYTFALTGGPSQPEVQGFTPVGTSDMVDVFSGDFNYNIPLLDVDGYPINIAYHSGITMDQEASWVGLGWNINPGVINRNMRGLPDDFNGDQVTHQINLKPNQTFGVNLGASDEIIGLELLKLGYTIGVKYNTYNGIGVEQSLDISISSGNSSKGSLSGNLGISSSSDDGLSLNPSVSYETKAKINDDGETAKLGASLGASFNSRTGLKSLTVGISATRQPTPDPQSALSIGASTTFNLGMPTFSPLVSYDMNNFSISGSFKEGFELFGNNLTASVSGYYSRQNLAYHNRTSPAYGYLHSEGAQGNDDALMDFNRENDGSYLKVTPALPTTNFTYDVYSVSGQGAGGSYRAFRNDIGFVYDASHRTRSFGTSVQLEAGEGDLFHVGGVYGVTYSTNKSRQWDDSDGDNKAAAKLTFSSNVNSLLNEKYTFREANEKSVDSDTTFINSSGGYDPVMFQLTQYAKFNTIADQYFVKPSGQKVPITGPIVRKARQKRNTMMANLTRNELVNGLGIERAHPQSFPAQAHHIAEITNLGNDGKRYVYGVAAYNTHQEEVSFAVGYTTNGTSNSHVGSCSTGLVNYTPGTDDSQNNANGLDNYYSNTIMPPYAHSYFLSSVLSADYVDIDTVKGPSDADLGTYVKFYNNKYSNNYQWRTPLGGTGNANYNQGLKTDLNDDKASFVYGTKELWYLDSIVTKNYIAIFSTSTRQDGLGCGKDGTLDATGSTMRELDLISLYSKADYRANGSNAIPLKQVHFVYDYSLCPGVANNSSGGGKLTLKQVYFTYQNSNKAKFSSYQFQYNGWNPSYDFKAYDRWGNYKPNTNADCNPTSTTGNLPTAEFPYVTQIQSNADSCTSAWHLTDISIPSGGSIHVNYESDDYAYVQNKQAMQMFKIIGIYAQDVGSTVQSISEPNVAALTNNGNSSNSPNNDFYIEPIPGYTNPNDYISGVDFMYFRCLMQFSPLSSSSYDYVPGYATIGGATLETYNGNPAIRIHLNPVTMKNTGSQEYSPITRAACQFGRLNLSRYVWNAPGVNPNSGFGISILNAIFKSSFVKNISQAIEGPNNALWDTDQGRNMVVGRSWVRLNNPTHKKLGGGTRVKSLQMNDAWNGMTNNKETNFSYGQQYSYTLNDGTSSGVATYEPQIGGDENPWKQPVFYDITYIMAPDENHYLEEPFGEFIFPSPSVGYSQVTVKNLQYSNVIRHATGKVIHNFYTAKDFPTITNRTSPSPVPEKTSPFSLSSLFKIATREYMTTTQGFSIELNDMHGKPKKQSVYQQGNDTTSISSVEYVYQSSNYLAGNFRLNNNATVIDPQGNVSQASLGVFYDMVADMRQSHDETYAVNTNGNLDDFFAFFDIALPGIWPGFSSEKTQFRSGTTTKVTKRCGLLQKTIAKDLGSTVTTENLAYDAETGQVLLTKTINDYDDPEYNLTYPAHWYYDGMGPAYKNIGSNFILLAFNSGVASMANANQYFVPGDEIGIYYGSPTILFGPQFASSAKKAWITNVTPTTITIADKQGNPLSGTNYIRVLRSGRRNMSTTPISHLTTLSNPLANFKSNVFTNVLQTSAVEYVQGWRTACDCFNDALILPSTNPYVIGTLGYWKQIRSHTFLTDRTKTNYDNNTNIRKDGIFSSYTPFYALIGNNWTIDDRNWTYVSQVTEYSPFTQELENVDALGRYSAATFGYTQTLATSVAANSRYRELGVDNFEDYGFSVCADNHFRFSQPTLSISNQQSHTGRNSIMVSPTNTASITKQLAPECQPAGCNILISVTASGGSNVVNISNGTAPYTIDYDIISGSPSITFPGGVMTISGSPYTINLTVVDANGCNAIQKLVQTIQN